MSPDTPPGSAARRLVQWGETGDNACRDCLQRIGVYHLSECPRNAANWKPTPLEEQLAEALAQGGFDETDAWNAVKAVIPVVRGHLCSEYDRGVEYGDKSARESVARRIGVL